MFINREGEMNYLHSLGKKSESQLLIVYGRRRIGKTELLREFSKKEKHLFFSSDLSSEQEQLRQFSQKVYTVTGDSFLEEQQFGSWEAALRYVFDHFPGKIPIVIIDEFPYLCHSNTALPSILQKIWDERSRQSRLTVILCGSYKSFMEKEVLAGRSPLFGRRTGQLLVEPMKFADARKFFPGYSGGDQVVAYSVLGGTPAYLQRFTEKKSIRQNIRDEILDRNAPLYAEPRFLLMEELNEPSIYFSVLSAIATGRTRLNQIAQHTGIPESQKVNKYISVLRELKIIRRRVPVTESTPHKSRKGIYQLEDHYFRFWFRYVYPNLSYLEEGDIDYVWSSIIHPDLDRFAGYSYEDICIQHLKELNRRGMLPFKARDIGPWWDRQDEIDIVALDGRGSYILCECKWTRKKVGTNLLEDLERKAQKFSDAKKVYYGFFSGSGFTRGLLEFSKERDENEIVLFDTDSLER